MLEVNFSFIIKIKKLATSWKKSVRNENSDALCSSDRESVIEWKKIRQLTKKDLPAPLRMQSLLNVICRIFFPVVILYCLSGTWTCYLQVSGWRELVVSRWTLWGIRLRAAGGGHRHRFCGRFPPGGSWDHLLPCEVVARAVRRGGHRGPAAVRTPSVW